MEKEKSLRSLLGDSLQIQGNSNPLENYPEDLKQGIIDYYAGRGMSLELFKKYYGFGKSRTIEPDQRYTGAYA